MSTRPLVNSFSGILKFDFNKFHFKLPKRQGSCLDINWIKRTLVS